MRSILADHVPRGTPPMEGPHRTRAAPAPRRARALHRPFDTPRSCAHRTLSFSAAARRRRRAPRRGPARRLGGAHARAGRRAPRDAAPRAAAHRAAPELQRRAGARRRRGGAAGRVRRVPVQRRAPERRALPGPVALRPRAAGEQDAVRVRGVGGRCVGVFLRWPVRETDTATVVGRLGRAGRTVCLGQRLAKVQLKLVTALVVLGFDLAPVDRAGRVLAELPRPNWNDALACKPAEGSCFLRYERA